MKRFLIAFVLTASAASAWADDARKVRFADYLDAVDANSLDLLAQQENVTSAREGIAIAGVRPDPQLTAGVASKELSAANKPSAATALTAGVAFTIETAGKRAARIRAAQSNLKLTQAGFESTRQQLYADSAAAFVEACRARAVLVRKQSSLKAFRDTVAANEVRQKAGDIGLLELRQSRVEAERFGLDARSAMADVEAGFVNLSGPLGKPFGEVFSVPPGTEVLACDLDTARLGSDADELVKQALLTRRDVRVAEAMVENARDNVELARTNRWVDPVVNVGLTNTPRIPPVLDGNGIVTNSPAEHSLTLGLTVTVPIPLSRLQHGELRQAESALTQAQLQLRSTVLKAEADVRATEAQYRAAADNVQTYTGGVLADSERVLDGIRTSYRRGATPLLDLLEAQRNADEVVLAYLQALADLANSRVRLQLSIGARPML